eukprot:SAG22_NODE_359_length_11758_cov_4.094254_10_plen_131_part_00
MTHRARAQPLCDIVAHSEVRTLPPRSLDCRCPQICSRVLEQTTNLVRDRLSRIWREKLTDIVHEEYFANSGYYHVEQKMQDADSRITEDVRVLSDGFTRFFTAGIYTATTGVFYSIKVRSARHGLPCFHN